MAVTQISDVIVPEVFAPYVQQLTEEKSRLIRSGAVARSAELDEKLAGGGLIFQAPSFKDLANDDDNVSDDTSGTSTPKNIGTSNEKAVRLSRNQSWSSMDLTEALAGEDPMEAIASRVADYWTRRQQAALIATMTGVFADNTANDSGDYTNDVSGVSFVDGVTNFSAEAFLDACVTMGDSQDSLGMVIVHSIVYNRMQKNNLIDFIPDSEGKFTIPTFLGRVVIVDDGMPRSGSVYQSWIFGAGAIRMGMGLPMVPAEVIRKPEAGNGGGQETLFSRTEWCFHPSGHAYVGTPANGGPSNAATSNNLAAAGSWNRVFPERKMIKVARLITREA